MKNAWQHTMDKIIETKQYSDEMISLWQEAFGDCREDVLFFLENAVNKSCICYYTDDKLVSMFFLVDCRVNDIRYKYIYAACTAAAYQGRGYMSELLAYCQEHYDYILLIPADTDLVNYYRKRKFNHKMNIENILFNERKEIREYLFEGCSLEKPFALAYKGE